MLTASGLGSGLDINSLVTQLVESERAGSDLKLDRQEAKFNSKFSALGSLKSALSVFKSSISELNNLSGYNGKLATSSDNSKFTATASSAAVPNNYSIAVSQLATPHALASTAIPDSNETALGTGTLTIRRGTTDYVAGTDTYNSFTLNPDIAAATITIDSSNNTLSGIMTAINDADIGVSAAIVNDGTGFRLLLSSDVSGEENSLELSVTDDDGNNTDALGLSRFAFNAAATNMEQSAAAQDANFTINGLAVSSASNTTTSAIPGVSLNLKQVTTGTVSLAVKADTAKVLNNVSSFIAGYNSYIETANSLSAYDQENDIPSALLGDFTLRSIDTQVNGILKNAVAGLTGPISNLSEMGITTTSSGTLEVNADKFNAALANNMQNITQMFAAVGVPTDADIQFSSATGATVVGAFEVTVTTLASSGQLPGDTVLPNFGGGGTVEIDADNNNLTVEIDGIDTGSITLTAGTYASGDDRADEIQVQINGTTAMREAGKTVSVTYDSSNDRFAIVSDSLGSESTVNITAVDTNSAATLGFSVATGTAGNDVAGSIGGNPAVGTGNTLVGATGTDAEGLTLTIAGNTTGSRGTVDFTRGVANQLSTLLTNLLEADGALESRIEAYKERIDDMAARRAEPEFRCAADEARFKRQFTSLE